MTPFFMSKPVLYKTDFYNTGYELISKLSDFGIQLSTNCRCSSRHLRAISFMTAMKDARMDEEEIARKWRKEHRELVDSWILKSKNK